MADNPERERVIDLVFSARTSREIASAERAILEWIEAHPEDEEYMLQAGESLQMVKNSLV